MIRWVHKCCLGRNSSYALMLPLHSNAITQILVSHTSLLHMTQLKIQNRHFTIHIWSLSVLLTQNIECLLSAHIPNLLLTDEKFEFVCKIKAPNHIFSRTCLSKTMIISYMIDFIKAVSCSERTDVSTK